MGTVLYKEYVACISPVGFAFGGWSGNQLLKTVEEWGSDVSLGMESINASDLPTSEGLVHDRSFLCPLPLSAKTVLDGPVYGSVGVKLWNMTALDGGDGVTLTKVYANIFKKDSSNVDTSLTGDVLVWSGTKYLDGGTYPNDSVTSTAVWPFWSTIDAAEIERNERIGLRVKLYGYAASGYTDTDRNRIYLACDQANKQTFFSVPIAVSVD